jgi:hypothetical protein
MYQILSVERVMDNLFEHKDKYKIEQLSDNSELTTLIQNNTKSILCIPENITKQSSYNIVMAETYDFAKWLRKKRQDISIDVTQSEGIKSLHSNEFWMPIVILASDMSVQVFLGIVSSYIYDRIKGALKHDKSDIHVQAYYKETPDEVIKKFSYDGSVEGFEKVAKKFNVNKFLE